MRRLRFNMKRVTRSQRSTRRKTRKQRNVSWKPRSQASKSLIPLADAYDISVEIKPLAQGRFTEAGNIRILCRVHNLSEASKMGI